MYFFKPVYNSEDVKTISFSYDGFDDDRKIGDCSCEIYEKFVIIKTVNISKDKPDFYEGLIRACLNFAGNRNVYMAKCLDDKYKNVLEMMGFEKNEEDVYVGDIPSLLHGSCEKCKK